jgi:CRP/FNR family cyclic AMP-dependent transcriptional regulator
MTAPRVPIPSGLIRSVSIFAGLDAATASALERLAEPRSFEEGAVVVSEDEPGDSLFVLVSGKVKVVLYGESGREVILTIFSKPGEFFGEMSLLDDEPRSATVMAIRPSTFLTLSRGDFRAYVDRHPSIALQILTELSRRLRRADAVIGDLALLDVFGRLAAKLKALAETDGEETEAGIVIRQRPTQAEIAAMIGASRETVSRALSELARRGDIVMTGKRLLIRRGVLLGGER